MTADESLRFCFDDYKYKNEKKGNELADCDFESIFNHWHKYFNNVVLKEDAIKTVKGFI
ncbi:MAG: hypothetical protein KA007_00175 [Candidatus Pacebacteria bacterium]|jgi:hypothetical protein|nr:hypothetical protein [Candidatus Paceibacterota bacterium]